MPVQNRGRGPRPPREIGDADTMKSPPSSVPMQARPISPLAPDSLTAIVRAQKYVAKIPGAVEGNGGDCQTLAVANVLVWDFALSAEDALRILREYNTKCVPPWKEEELVRKLQSAERQPHTRPRGNLLRKARVSPQPMLTTRGRLQQQRTDIDPVTAVENWLGGFRGDEADLWAASPIRPPEDWRQDAICLLGHLYQSGDLINFVTDFVRDDQKARPCGRGETCARDALINRWRASGTPVSAAGGWLRMNPVDGTGVADTNVKAFRYALVESDVLPPELFISLLGRLPLPIAAILTSGGRSLHAWVRVNAPDLNEFRRLAAGMLAILCRFGVDPQNKNPSRLSRLPGAIRSIGGSSDGRQRLLYLNPDPQQRPILS